LSPSPRASLSSTAGATIRSPGRPGSGFDRVPRIRFIEPSRAVSVTVTAGEPPFETKGAESDHGTEERARPRGDRPPIDADSPSAPAEASGAYGSRAVSPTQIGEFVRLNGCPQYHAYEFTPGAKEAERERKDWKEAFEPLSPLLAVEGETFERDCEQRLAAGTFDVVDHTECEDHEGTVAALRAVLDRVRSRLPGSEPIVTSQTYLDGTIGAWAVAGNADFLVFQSTPRGVHVRILDAKAAHEQKTYQQVQVATYTLLLRTLLADMELPCEVRVSGGVLTRESDFDAVTPEELPDFDLTPRETDVRRLLVAGGVFDRLVKGESDEGESEDDETKGDGSEGEGGGTGTRTNEIGSEPAYQLGPKCHGCSYKEACYTNAIESKSNALLGLTRGEQARLAEAGIETIAELAALCYPPENPRPYEYDRLEPVPERRDQYRTLVAEPGLGERLPGYVQRAQAMVGRFDPDHLYGRAEHEAPWLLGAGDGTLPADDPPYDAELPIARRSLIRVYIHVVYDHRRNRIAMASACVTSSRHGDRGYDPVAVAELTAGVPDDPEEADAVETALLESFVEDLFDAIRVVAARTDRAGRAPLHVYFYADSEREALVEATKRHAEVPEAAALRDLLGLRGACSDGPDADTDDEAVGTTGSTAAGGIGDGGGAGDAGSAVSVGTALGDGPAADQPMVSVVEREFRARKASKIPTTGIVAAIGQLTPDENALGPSDWTYTRTDGTKVDLREAFRYRLFDDEVPYRETGDGSGGDGSDGGVELLCEPAEADGYYPSRARRGADVPLEYVWAATGRLTDDVVEEITSGEGHGPVEPFRWVDGDGETRIGREDLLELGRTLAAGVAHVERGLRYRSSDVTERKRPIDLASLDSFSLGDAAVGRGARDFLDIEYATGRREALSHYALPVVQRIRTGESVPVVVEHVSEHEGDLRVEGRLPYDKLFEEGGRVARSCRVKGADESGGGSWMVANELDRAGNPKGSTSPRAIECGVPVTVSHLDPDRREIAFSAADRFPRSSRYESWHRGWTTDATEADDRTVHVTEGDVFVLDPGTDDVNGQRAFDVLSGPGDDANSLGELLDDLARGSREEPTIEGADEEAIAAFLDWLEASPGLAPNPEQSEFVRETEGQISLLQGPPGTGKTSGALALAVLSRVLAADSSGTPFAGLVVGESHKAVDEVAADVADCYERYRDDSGAPGSLADLDIVRLRDAPADTDAGAAKATESPIEYLDYYADTDRVEELAGRLLSSQRGPQRTFGDLGGFEAGGSGGSSGSSAGEASETPVLVFATPGRLYGLVKAIGRAARDVSGNAVFEEGRSFFDLLAVDEASMMRLPSFLLCGAFVHDDAQVLVAGDHRQMPPVRVHDWEAEDRRPIEQVAPYCSALDFCRLLRGEDVDGVDAEELTLAREATLPVTRLEETYRCHGVVADFLAEHVYRHDEIDYRSSVTETIETTGTADGSDADRSEGLAAALGDAPLTLVLHEEAASQQVNPTEAALTAAIADSLPEAGVVTPHNAQKGLLGSHLGENAEVDTVERFQGGERESIVVSATASDPDFLEAERDFILNPNRLTVAMSRMQRKLVVVASKSVFEVVPPDTDGYERARLWKGLYEDLDVLDRDPEWCGTVGDFAGGGRVAPDGGDDINGDDGDDAASAGESGGRSASGAIASGVDADAGVEIYSLGSSPSSPTDNSE
jgi:hypothetical protein